MAELDSSVTAAIPIIASEAEDCPSNEQGVTYLSSIMYKVLDSAINEEQNISENSLLAAPARIMNRKIVQV